MTIRTPATQDRDSTVSGAAKLKVRQAFREAVNGGKREEAAGIAKAAKLLAGLRLAEEQQAVEYSTGNSRSAAEAKHQRDYAAYVRQVGGDEVSEMQRRGFA